MAATQMMSYETAVPNQANRRVPWDHAEPPGFIRFERGPFPCLWLRELLRLGFQEPLSDAGALYWRVNANWQSRPDFVVQRPAVPDLRTGYRADATSAGA